MLFEFDNYWVELHKNNFHWRISMSVNIFPLVVFDFVASRIRTLSNSLCICWSLYVEMTPLCRHRVVLTFDTPLQLRWSLKGFACEKSDSEVINFRRVRRLWYLSMMQSFARVLYVFGGIIFGTALESSSVRQAWRSGSKSLSSQRSEGTKTLLKLHTQSEFQ